MLGLIGAHALVDALVDGLSCCVVDVACSSSTCWALRGARCACLGLNPDWRALPLVEALVDMTCSLWSMGCAALVEEMMGIVGRALCWSSTTGADGRAGVLFEGHVDGAVAGRWT